MRWPDWMLRARCRSLVRPCRKRDCKHCDTTCHSFRAEKLATAAFFGEPLDVALPGFPTIAATRTFALSLCARCPVWAECLTWAAASTDSWSHGIYGGLCETERTMAPKDKPWQRDTPDLAAALAVARAKRGDEAA